MKTPLWWASKSSYISVANLYTVFLNSKILQMIFHNDTVVINILFIYIGNKCKLRYLNEQNELDDFLIQQALEKRCTF